MGGNARCALRRDLLIAPVVFIATRALGRETAEDERSLPRIEDFRDLARRIERDRIPLLILFSTAGCPYCLEVRRNYLRPRLGGSPAVALIREIDIGSAQVAIDVNGKAVTDADLARRYGVSVVPVVLLVDAAGRPLAEPLIGVDRAGFYESYLLARMETATRALRAAR